jgi:hypothetical protein
LRGILSTVSVMGVIATLLLLGVNRDKYLSSGFERVSTGMSRQQVAALMGTPKRIERCSSGPFAPRVLDRCVETNVYSQSFAPLDPEYRVVWLDEDQRVIDKYQYQSP